jgi:hypothetical protein
MYLVAVCADAACRQRLFRLNLERLSAVDGEIVTIRLTWRGSVIRIFGADYWRKGKAIYEQQNQLRR